MQTQEVTKLVNGAFERLAQDIDAGHSEQLRRYLAAMGRFHRYSVGNIMLILSQRPDATRVAGFHTWRTLARQVRKGERGIAIMAPMLLKERGDAAEDADAEEAARLRFRVAYVFDVAQTDGEPLPAFASARGDPGPLLARLRRFATDRRIAVAYDERLGSALGSSQGGRIVLRLGQSPAEEFTTLAHELAHELLHRGSDGKPPRTVRELEAEAVAFAVAAAAELDVGTASRDYIHLYRGNRDLLKESLGRIRSAACDMIGALLDPPLRAAA